MLNTLLRQILCVPSMGTHFLFTKNLWIGYSGASCHTINNDTGLFYIININELIQGSARIMPATKRQASCQCPTSWWNWTGLHSMAHEVLPKGRCKPVFPNVWTLAEKDNIKWSIVVKSTDGDIIFDCQFKTCDSWAAGVDFLWETSDERAQSATAPCKKNINNLHVELGHLSEWITHDTTEALGI